MGENELEVDEDDSADGSFETFRQMLAEEPS